MKKILLGLLAVFGIALLGTPAMATLSPSFVNFYRVPCGQTRMQSVNFYNNTDQNLTSVNVSVVGINFRASGFCPYNMAPHTFCSITVTYSPRQPGSDFGTLYVNAYPLSGETASLNGSCYQP